MKYLILNTDYAEFLHWLYARQPGLHKQPYEEQMRARNESLFGVADFYSSALRKLGHEAWDIHANNESMQKAWAREYGIRVVQPTPVLEKGRRILRQARRIAAQSPARYLKPFVKPVLRSLATQLTWFYRVLGEQVKHYQPDVILNQSMDAVSPRFLKQIKPSTGLLIGQHAATLLPDSEEFSCYDLIISSFPPTIEYFRNRGIPAELNRLGFEPKILPGLRERKKIFDLSFIGSFTGVHGSRVELLEVLCAQFPQMRIWAPSIEHMVSKTAIQKCYAGAAWGREMYEILYTSKITINHHGDIAPYANNLRLYEATGVGTLLITDWKVNLHEIFEPGKEVATYRTSRECAALIQYYLEHDDERESIAKAGQQRTLREHSYFHRMQELVDIVTPLFRQHGKGLRDMSAG